MESLKKMPSRPRAIRRAFRGICHSAFLGPIALLLAVSCWAQQIPMRIVPAQSPNRNLPTRENERRTRAELFVSGFYSSSVQRYAGPFEDNPGMPFAAPGLTDALYAAGVSRRPWGLVFGPDGDFYIANKQGAEVIVARVFGPDSSTPGAPHPAPGQSGDIFIPFDQNTGWSQVTSVAFGPDGMLYVGGRGAVRRYQAGTGKSLGEFTTGYSLSEVQSIAFGPDGDLYVANYDSCVQTGNTCAYKGEIIRFNGLTGAFLDSFISQGTGGVGLPYSLAFGPDGNLYVASYSYITQSGSVLRFRGPFSQAAGEPFPGLAGQGAAFTTGGGSNPLFLAFGPDGNLYTSESDNSGSRGSILVFEGASGRYLGVYVQFVPGGPRGLTFYRHHR